MMFCLKPQKIKYEKLPFDFKERLVDLAPLKDLHNLGKACPDVKPACILRPDYHDQVKIVDNPDAYRTAVKMAFWLGILRFFNCIRYCSDGPYTISAIWGSVVKTKDIVRKNRVIYVADTLNLHCESIETCEKVIPFITGPYSRLIVTGNITWKQVKRLITAHVKQVRIDARIHIKPEERSNFVNFVTKFCRGNVYKFSFDCEHSDHLIGHFVEALKHHKTHQANLTRHTINVFSKFHSLSHDLSILFLMMFTVFYSMKYTNSLTKAFVNTFIMMCQYCIIIFYFGDNIFRPL